MIRDYVDLAGRIPRHHDRTAQMQAVVDLLWQHLHPTGVSWVGFYLHSGNELVLGPRRDKPACSPIGLHGVCGQVLAQREPIAVRDVAELGANYIACDPLDRSEVAVPCVAPDGTCWGVLDLDSHDVDAFSQSDIAGLQAVLRAAGLST